jgi:putative DNA primase/helicase
MFAPLPDNVVPIGRKPSRRKASRHAYDPILPVPDDAPPPPQFHPQRGEPTCRFVYRDAAGRVLGYVYRFDHGDGRKDFAPLAYCRNKAAGTDDWRWQSFQYEDGRRPIYGLDRLAAAPQAAVLVVEGEKAADAATELLPAFVRVTSAGGSKSAKHADWGALAGRNVVVFPDHDDAGRHYAREVAELCRSAGAAMVRIVNVPNEFPESWDLADPIPVEWGGRREVEALIDNAPIWEPPAQDGIKPPFILKEDGVYRFAQKTGWVWVCSPLEVIGCTRDAQGKSWGRLLVIIDRDGNKHEWAVPCEMLAKDGGDFREVLLRLGLTFDPAARTHVDRYVLSCNPKARVLCVPQVGWHEDVFVLPDRMIGHRSEKIVLQNPMLVEQHIRRQGEGDQWRRNIGRLCVGNSRLLFAVSCALAAPLLHIADEENGGFHLCGSSSIGKTTALHVAASVVGPGGKDGYIRSWRATSNGLEGVAQSYCDLLLPLDELSQVDGREAGAIAYMLANGAGKSRARRNGAARPPASWRIMFLSTGEMTLADKMNEQGRQARAGQEARLAEIPADAGAGFGLFENLHTFDSGDALARCLRDEAGRNYGVIIREFLEKITDDPSAVTAQLKEIRQQFVDRFCPRYADGQVKRVAARFGLVAAAGELAARLRVLPWPDGEALAGAGKCFAAWVDARGGVDAAEVTRGVEQVRAFFQQFGVSRFSEIGRSGEARDDLIRNRAGYRALDRDGDYFVYPGVFRGEICKGYDPKLMAKRLIEMGLLVAGKDSVTVQKRLPGARNPQRVYHIPSSIVADPNSIGSEEIDDDIPF